VAVWSWRRCRNERLPRACNALQRRFRTFFWVRLLGLLVLHRVHVQRKCVVDVEVQLMPIKLNELCKGAEVVKHVSMLFGASGVAWYRI
jgi:hypothetical protein